MENFDFKRFRKSTFLLALLNLSLVSILANSQPIITLKPIITSGLTTPMQILNAGDGSGRIFVIERQGIIKVFDGSASAPNLTTFFDLNAPIQKVGTLGEGGLLSVAFHPDYEKTGNANRGVFFAFYTNTRDINGDLVIERYRVSEPTANNAIVTERNVFLKIPHRKGNNHNGGEMHFGKDGFLYISTGDGGGAGDTDHNAQRTAPETLTDSSHFLGKMLRINVNTPSENRLYSIPGTNPFGNEIYDYGLRNPFRWNFDRLTGDMWIGDVGQSNSEEIDFRPASRAPGVNYGWNCYEGTLNYSDPSPLPSCATLTNFIPAYSYKGQSVIGGVVYRGSKYLDLIGYYVGADHYSGNIHLIKRNDANTAWVTTVQLAPPANSTPPPIINVTNIGESENGELYAVSIATNTIYHVESSGPLPVKLAGFDGVKTNEGARLYWETSSEENFQEFEIEYSSDLGNFSKVGAVMAENSANGAKYQFSHSISFNGNTYYRLKMINADASFEYSRIVSVKEDDPLAGDFVRPSLINSAVMNLIIADGFQKLEVIGINGKVFDQQDISGKRGAMEVPIEKLSSGIYIVRLVGNDKVNQQKVLILH